MEILKYCGAALITLAVILLLRAVKSDFYGMAALAAAVVLFGVAIGNMTPLFVQIRGYYEDSGFSDYFGILWKALGVTLCISFTSEICRDAGEAALASKLELLGKIEILLLTLPILQEILSLAAGLMNTA